MVSEGLLSIDGEEWLALVSEGLLPPWGKVCLAGLVSEGPLSPDCVEQPADPGKPVWRVLPWLGGSQWPDTVFSMFLPGLTWSWVVLATPWAVGTAS